MSGARHRTVGGSPTPSVVVVGGGLAGLVAAYRLARGPGDTPTVDVRVLEGAGHVGGSLHTERVEGFVVEGGADGFVSRGGDVERLARDLGIGGDLAFPRPCPVRAYLRSRAGFAPLLDRGGSPLSRPRSLLTSPLVSWRAKARAALEPLVPRRRSPGDESLASFLTRRLGRRAYLEIFEALLAGVYGAEPDELSAAGTVPHMVEAEAAGRSLLSLGHGGAGRTDRARYPGEGRRGPDLPPLLSFREGMSTLPDALAHALGPESVRTSVRVRAMRRTDCGWRILTDARGEERADAVVLATPAPVSACLLPGCVDMARELKTIRSGLTAVVNIAYPGAAVGRALDGHGYLNRRDSGRAVSAVTWSSSKFEGRAPTDTVLLRAFVRGDAIPQDPVSREPELCRMVRDELADGLGIHAPPLWTRVHVWSVPVYGVGHPDRVAAVRRAAAGAPGLSVAGSWYDGVGVEAVVRSADRAAEEVRRFIARGVGG